MSTANKLTYLNVTKQKLKQAINNIGGEVTDETTFRNYVAELENAYDNLPKTEYQEGTEINLGKTLKGKLDYENGVVGIGQDEQDSTTGINLFVDITTQTLNGMTLTRTDNGYILNGTTTDNTIFRGIISNPINSNKTLVAKCNVTISNANVQIKTRSSNASQLRSITLSTADTWVVSSGEFQDAMCDIYIKTGTTLNNALLQPMLLNGTYTTINVPDYEKYTGGQTSPNPSYPQEIKYVRGWQLFDKSNYLQGYAYMGSEKQANANWGIAYIECVKNQTFTISGLKGYANVYIAQTDTSKTFVSNLAQRTSSSTQYTITSTQTGYIGVTFLWNEVGEGSELNTMMINEGTEARPYLPYNTIEEVVSGKNLLDIYNTRQAGYSVTTNGITFTWNDDGSISISGTSTSANAYVDIYSSTTKIIGKPGERITYCLLENTSNDVVCHIYDYADGTYKNNNAGTIIAGHTNLSNATGSLVRIIIPSSNVTINQKVYPIIVEGAYSSSNLPTYEPYITPTSYQLSLGDKELYDECYIVGSPDNWKFVDNMYKTKLKDIQLSGDWSVTQQNNLYCFWFLYEAMYDIPKGRMLDSNNNLAPILSNYFGSRNVFYNANTEKNVIVKNTQPTSPMFIVAVDGEIASSVAEWKNYIANHEDLYVVYSTKEPLETPITDETLISQLNAWYNAQSINGTTIITSNGNLPMIIKCRGLKGE